MTTKEINKKFEKMSRQAANTMSVDGTRPSASTKKLAKKKSSTRKK